MAVPIGLVLMGASALAQGIRGISQGNKAKDLESVYNQREKEIEPVSPMLTSYLNRISQQERAMRAGTDSASAFARQGLSNALAQTQNNLVRASGPGAVNNLLRSQQGFNQGIAGVAAGASDRADGMLQYQGALTQNINQLMYNRQLKRRNMAQANWAHMKQSSNDNLNSLFGIGAQIATMLPDMQLGGGGNVLKDGGIPQGSTAAPYSYAQPDGPPAPESYSSQGSSLLPDNYQFPTGVQAPPINYGF